MVVNKKLREFAATVALGPKGLERLQKGFCPFCGDTIHLDQFKDQQSVNEFEISGLCQKCQDEMFED